MDFWPEIKQGAASAILSAGYPFSGNAYYVGQNSPIFGRRIDTIAEALATMVPRDILFLGPQRHEEGNLVIPSTLTNITIIGSGNRGACFIEPTGANDKGLQVLADDVTLVNVGVAGKGTADYALEIGDEAARFRAFGCKFEGPDGICISMKGCADILLRDTEICWAVTGISFVGGVSDFPTQIFFDKCRFHNLSLVHITDAVALVQNLEVRDCTFDAADDGTEPTDYLTVDDVGSTGIFSGNRFAIATNASAKLTIGANIRWSANATEAGWSVARPA